MINTVNSKMRMQAAARLMIDGESMLYAAGLYSLPVREFQDYLGGLFAESLSIPVEINKPKCYEGHIANSKSRQPNIEPPSFPAE